MYVCLFCVSCLKMVVGVIVVKEYLSEFNASAFSEFFSL